AHHHPSFKQPETSAPYMVPVASTTLHLSPSPQTSEAATEPQLDTQRVERLKVRNRRLEALVAVLRHRAERQ
ncbi:MAG: hypothetical protein M3Y72_25080, partial [Acidobacteriota bacterium]|nr:hypothetical protein [Acidobacteriota bacterium]